MTLLATKDRKKPSELLNVKNCPFSNKHRQLRLTSNNSLFALHLKPFVFITQALAALSPPHFREPSSDSFSTDGTSAIMISFSLTLIGEEEHPQPHERGLRYMAVGKYNRPSPLRVGDPKIRHDRGWLVGRHGSGLLAMDFGWCWARGFNLSC